MHCNTLASQTYVDLPCKYSRSCLFRSRRSFTKFTSSSKYRKSKDKEVGKREECVEAVEEKREDQPPTTEGKKKEREHTWHIDDLIPYSTGTIVLGVARNSQSS